MYHSEDFERLYFRYLVEVQFQDRSIEQFCKEQKVPYGLFSDWLDSMRKQATKEHAQGLFSTDKDFRIRQLLECDRERDLDLRARDLVLEDLMAQLVDLQKSIDVSKSESGTAKK